MSATYSLSLNTIIISIVETLYKDKAVPYDISYRTLIDNDLSKA